MIFFLLLFFALETTSITVSAHALMTYEEYAAIPHALPIPYTFILHKPNQSLFYCGAQHSCDPQHEQYPQLEAFWGNFLQETAGQNCVVLIEGSKRAVKANKEEAIMTAGGEGGLITFLADQAHIPVICPEPDQQYLTTELLKDFSHDEVWYTHFAQNVLGYHRCKKVNAALDFEEYIYRSIVKDKEYLAAALDRLNHLHERLFNNTLDIHNEQFFYDITNPVTQDTLINKICRKASIIRDNYIIDCIKQLIQQGKNVFVVYGFTHAVMQEKSIRTAWTNAEY
jgi:hypothetical protein